MSTKINLNYYHDFEKVEVSEYDKDLYDIETFNPEENDINGP